MNKLAHPDPGVKQHLHHESVPAGMAIGGFNQPFDFGAIQSFYGSSALARSFETEFAARLFDYMLGLVVGQVMLAPKLDRLAGDILQ
jgi:hypothetical protein